MGVIEAAVSHTDRSLNCCSRLVLWEHGLRFDMVEVAKTRGFGVARAVCVVTLLRGGGQSC